VPEKRVGLLESLRDREPGPKLEEKFADLI
jgi:hypothetical protein